MWLGPLPVCLVEHHHGKVRRLRLVLATITHLTKAEINSLVEGPYLPTMQRRKLPALSTDAEHA